MNICDYMFLCGNWAIGQFELFLCFLNFSYMFLCVETELLVNFELFLCGNWAMIYLFLCGNWAMIYFCLVEIERGGVINLLPDNLSEIGVEYVKVSYSLHCSYWIIRLFFFFFFFTLCLNLLLCLELFIHDTYHWLANL